MLSGVQPLKYLLVEELWYVYYVGDFISKQTAADTPISHHSTPKLMLDKPSFSGMTHNSVAS
jgi:hypothetical protein